MPSVRIDGDRVDISSVGTAVILSGTGILTIGDTSALVQVLVIVTATVSSNYDETR